MIHAHTCLCWYAHFLATARTIIFLGKKKALDLFLQELDTDMVASKATLDTAHNKIMSRPLPAKEWDKIEAAGADRLESGDCKCERLALLYIFAVQRAACYGERKRVYLLLLQEICSNEMIRACQLSLLYLACGLRLVSFYWTLTLFWHWHGCPLITNAFSLWLFFSFTHSFAPPLSLSLRLQVQSVSARCIPIIENAYCCRAHTPFMHLAWRRWRCLVVGTSSLRNPYLIISIVLLYYYCCYYYYKHILYLMLTCAISMTSYDVTDLGLHAPCAEPITRSARCHPGLPRRPLIAAKEYVDVPLKVANCICLNTIKYLTRAISL